MIPENSTEMDLATLAKDGSTLAQLMQAIRNLEQKEHPRQVKIGLSGSATIDLLGVYLKKHGLLSGTSIDIVQGNYDDPIGDIDLFANAGVDFIVLLPFFDSLLPAFESRLENLDQNLIAAKEQEIRERYRLTFEKARSLKSIFVGTFHRLNNFAEPSGKDKVAITLARFNSALEEEAAAFNNIRLIDNENIIRAIGQKAAFDQRFYFRNKAPYTATFMNELARRVTLAARGFGAYFYKVLVLDCDNTLWGGIIGEDLLSGIKLGPYDYPGNIFWRIQQEVVELESKGILICLCSKNNPADVDDVLQNHPDMVLRDKHIVVKKVNWEDKASNLRALAKELNLGLDSFVFIDDSSFECEAIRQQLPMVKTIQVPSTLSDYPQTIQQVKELFLAGGISAESKGKTEAYRQRADAENLKATFDSQEEYLASLELKVELSRNAQVSIARISELSQKSNQFNLTTRRYSVSEVEQMMASPNHNVYSLVVRDKFGEAGLTGVVMMRYEAGIAYVDNFFMSCRVIGRGIETAIWNCIFSDAIKSGCGEFKAEFIASAKNAQVADFFDRLGLPLINDNLAGHRIYALKPELFNTPATPWIEMTYA